MDDEDVITAAQMTLASAPKFAEFLRSLGAEVPMKPSPSNPEKMIPALSKTDEAFLALQESDNELVALAASARLGVKSTQVETRLEAFIAVARACNGMMPIALAYYGGHTGRWGGALGLNQQNLPRIPRDKLGNIIPKISNALRMCLRAPKGYKVVVADLSGIELRVNHFLWQVESSMALYQASPGDADLYKDFATTLYNVMFDEVTKDQRQIGKVAHLGLGFGAGWKTFITIAKTMGGVDIDEGESKSIVSSWRRMYVAIQQGWKRCQNALTAIVTGATQAVDPWGLVTTTPEGFLLPSGRLIYYPELRQEVENGSATWKMGRGRNTTFLNGGKCDENIVQALARDVIADNMLEVKKLTGHWPVLSVHDELIYIVPDAEAESHLAIVQGVMRTPPKWWPELVTWSEGDIAQSYGEAK
jgi:DNA polymerase